MQIQTTEEEMQETRRKKEAEDSALLRPQENSTSQSKNIIWSVCSFILITEFCERIAYYGLTGSLPIFFRKHLRFSNALATELNSLFSSVTYVTPLLGAYVADTYLGRYKTIVVFCLWYIVGLILCVIAANPVHLSGSLFMIALFGVVAFGSGGIKPNVVVLGADQFDTTIEDQKTQKDSFFNWFYWSINMGATFSFGVLTNIAVNGLSPWIPKEYGFFASFLIPSIVFMIAFMVFVGGESRYRKCPPQGSALGVFFRVLFQAASGSAHGKLVLSNAIVLMPAIILTVVSYFVEDKFWHLVFAGSGAILVLSGTVMLIVFGRSTDWIHAAHVECGGTFDSKAIQETAQVVRLLPYLGFMVMFWAVYGQQSNNFVIQGCQMDLRLSSSTGGEPIQLSSAMLSILDSSVILLFIPIFDKFIYPCVQSFGIETTVMRKIGAGFFFCFLAMVVAAITEIERKDAPLIHRINSNCAGENEELAMSNISVWWQTPQYVLIGIGEILTSISSYDLFYSEVPESMRSVCQALNLLTTTLGYIVAGATNSVLSHWITSDLNDGELQYVFVVMAVLMLMNLIAFIMVSQSFQYHEEKAPTAMEKITGFSPAWPRAHRGRRRSASREQNA